MQPYHDGSSNHHGHHHGGQDSFLRIASVTVPFRLSRRRGWRRGVAEAPLCGLVEEASASTLLQSATVKSGHIRELKYSSA